MTVEDTSNGLEFDGTMTNNIMRFHKTDFAPPEKRTVERQTNLDSK